MPWLRPRGLHPSTCTGIRATRPGRSEVPCPKPLLHLLVATSRSSLHAEPSCTELHRPLLPPFSRCPCLLTVLLIAEPRHSAAVPRLSPTTTLLHSFPPYAQVPTESHRSRPSTRELLTSTPPPVSSAAPPPSLVLALVGHPHCLLVVCSQPRHSRAGATLRHHSVDFTVVQYSEPSAASYSSLYFDTESPLPRPCFPVQCHLVSLAVTLRCRATGTEHTMCAASARSSAGRGVGWPLHRGPCIVLCNRTPWAT
jgi:hypothetical protein